jgi:hypothetical protein
MTTKRRFAYSPAALELMSAGVSLTELGRRLGLSTAAISRKLQGDLGGPIGPLGDLIVELAGSEVYDRILGHLGLVLEVPE